MSDKIKYPRAKAVPVAHEVACRLKPYCHRIIVAGSLRRGSPTVGDVEIVYVPKTEVQPTPGDFFAIGVVNLADKAIAEMETEGILAKRTDVNGSTMFGAKNKLMVHCASEIPVDIFATDEACWFNYLTCRTGPAESNMLVATLAQRKGWHWSPYGPGFTHPASGRIFEIDSEEKVFAFVGMPQPPKRVEIPI